MTISSSWSLIFEVKSTWSELVFIRVLRLQPSSEDFGRIRKTSDFFGRLQTSSGIFGNDRVFFKNPSTPGLKVSRLYRRQSWQVYMLRLNTWLPLSVELTFSSQNRCQKFSRRTACLRPCPSDKEGQKVSCSMRKSTCPWRGFFSSPDYKDL